MELKNFPTKKYTFGVSRKDGRKIHVQKVYWLAEEGIANPGPGTYNPPNIIGSDTPKFSMSAKNNLLESK